MSFVKKIAKNKKHQCLVVFLLAVLLYSSSILIWRKTELIETGGIFLTLISMLVIMFYTLIDTNEGIVKQIKAISDSTSLQIENFQKGTADQINAIQVESERQIQHLQKLNNEQIGILQDTSEKHIKTLTDLTGQQIIEIGNSTNKHIEAYKIESEKQIKTLTELTIQQIKELHETTNKHIKAYQVESEKQIKNFQESTQKEIDAFVNSIEIVVSRLEDVTEVLVKMSGQNQEILQHEKVQRELSEKQWELKLSEMSSLKVEKTNELQWNRPRIFARTEVGQYFIFWKHVWIYIHNTGGDASNIKIKFTFVNSNNQEQISLQREFEKLERNRQVNFRIGNAKDYYKYDKVMIAVSLMGIGYREFYSNQIYDRNDQVWLDIGLIEKPPLKSIS